MLTLLLQPNANKCLKFFAIVVTHEIREATLTTAAAVSAPDLDVFYDRDFGV